MPKEDRVLRKDPDQIARENIPTRADVPTQYDPEQNLLMIKVLDSISQVGSILIPETARVQLCEGHIVAVGPAANKRFSEGDCVTWGKNAEYRMEVDGVKFVIVPDTAILMRIPREQLATNINPLRKEDDDIK
jgi:co-chaperonin GroES (HSP10)